MDTALAIMENVDFANDIQAVTPVDFALRRKSQTIALASTAKMIGLIDLAYTRCWHRRKPCFVLGGACP